MYNIDVVVIGAGVSGMTSALYLKRANKNVVLLENDAPGGQLTRIPNIENYPGFLEIAGPDLAMNIYNQLIKENVDYRYGKVLSVDKKNDYFIVRTDKEELTCKNVIIATGRSPRKLGIDLEDKLIGKGISYCALCDGNFFKNKEIAVVGGGDSALSESLYLSEIVKKVYLIYRGNEFKSQQYLIDRVNKKNNIVPIFNSNIQSFIVNDDKLEGINIGDEEIAVEGIFVYIGFIPNTDIVKNICSLENGYVIVDKNQQTSIDGLYAIGDVCLKNTYQIATAIGDAVVCANAIINKK